MPTPADKARTARRRPGPKRVRKAGRRSADRGVSKLQGGAREATGPADRPGEESTREKLIRIVGARAAEKLMRELGGEAVRIPVLDKRKDRNARVKRLLAEGRGYREVARLVGLSPRHVVTIANKP